MVTILKCSLTFLPPYFSFSPSFPVNLAHPTPFQHQIRSPLIQDRHTAERKTGQTTSFCVFVFQKPQPTGEILSSHPEETGMEQFL